MPESSTKAASTPGAQAKERLYTADEVRELMIEAAVEWDAPTVIRTVEQMVQALLDEHEQRHHG